MSSRQHKTIEFLQKRFDDADSHNLYGSVPNASRKSRRKSQKRSHTGRFVKEVNDSESYPLVKQFDVDVEYEDVQNKSKESVDCMEISEISLRDESDRDVFSSDNGHNVVANNLFLANGVDAEPSCPAVEELQSSRELETRHELREKSSSYQNGHPATVAETVKIFNGENSSKVTSSGNEADCRKTSDLDNVNTDSAGAKHPSEVEYGGAVWDIFRRQDVPKLEEYLLKHQNEFRHINNLPVKSVSMLVYLCSWF